MKLLSLWYRRFLLFWKMREIIKTERCNKDCRQKTRRIKRQFQKEKYALGLIGA